MERRATVASPGLAKGEWHETEKVSLERASQATEKAVKELELTSTSKQKDAFDGEVVARRATVK